MSFWRNATAQAGREFGSRYWRWFAAVRVARVLLPIVMWVVVVASAVAGVVVAYRWISPDWAGVGTAVAGGAGEAGRWIIVAVIVAAVVAGIGWGLTALWRANSWRWSRF